MPETCEVITQIRWTRRGDDDVFEIDDVLLVAIPSNGRWYYDIVIVDCSNDDISDVVYYCRVKDLLPEPPT